METLVAVVYFGSLVMSFIANIIYISIVMPVLHDVKKRRQDVGGPEIEINRMVLRAAYNANRPLFLCDWPFSFLNFFIIYGNSLFFIIFGVLATINVYVATKSIVMVALSTIALFAVYKILSIIAFIVADRLIIKRSTS